MEVLNMKFELTKLSEGGTQYDTYDNSNRAGSELRAPTREKQEHPMLGKGAQNDQLGKGIPKMTS